MDITEIYFASDGWDVSATIDGESRVFHFADGQPNEAQAITAIEAALATEQPAQQPPPVTIKTLPPDKVRQLQTALNEIEIHARPLARAWFLLTTSQRDALLSDKPVLARLVRLAQPFNEAR